MQRPSVKAIYFFGALGELMFGYDLGVIGVALVFIAKEFQLDPLAQGLVVGALLGGATVGVGIAGILADRYGRKPTLVAMAVVFILGGMGGALAPTVAWLIAARALAGLGVGASAVVVMVYLAEIAPSHERGRVSSMGQLMVVIGVLLAYSVDYLLAPLGAWRWMIGFSVVPSLILLAGLSAVPESPRWLVQAGDRQRARQVLLRLGREATVEAELIAIEAALRCPPGGRLGGFSRLRLCAAPELRRTLGICAGLAVAGQLLGCNVITYYAPTILINVGFGPESSIAANLALGVAGLIATIWALRLVDRAGRRTLLLRGTASMAAAMIALGIITAFDFGQNNAAAWLTLAAVVWFYASLALSWGVCTRVLISELLPQEVRSSSMGLILVLNWAANFCVGLLFPVMWSVLGASLTFCCFGAIGGAAWLFVVRWVPETKGRSLEQIQQALRMRTPESAVGKIRFQIGEESTEYSPAERKVRS